MNHTLRASRLGLLVSDPPMKLDQPRQISPGLNPRTQRMQGNTVAMGSQRCHLNHLITLRGRKDLVVGMDWLRCSR